MRAARLYIRNIMAIEELEFTPGGFNVVSGKNGEGKSSFLAALRAITGGGDDATLLRKGAKKGEVVLVLDDGMTITRRYTEKGAQPLIVERDGHRIPTPATVIKELSDIIAVNPIDFINARKKDRVDILLDSLPIKVDPIALSEIVGHPVTLNPRLTPFEQVDFLHQSIFDERTGTNRALREKRATIDQLNQTIPDDDSQYTAEDETGLLVEIDKIDAERDTEYQRIDDKLTALQDGYAKITLEIRGRAGEHTDDLRRQIRALEQKISEAHAAMQESIATETAKLNEIKGLAARQREITATKHGQARAAIAGQIEAIRGRAQQAARVQNTRDTIQQMCREADTLDADSQRQTAALSGIDAYKTELLASLPVSGLEVREGEIFRNGIPFDRLNTAQQIGIAVEIAKLRAGDLRIICVDGLEMLDTERFNEFHNQIVTADLQAFVARVSDSEFQLAAAA